VRSRDARPRAAGVELQIALPVTDGVRSPARARQRRGQVEVGVRVVGLDGQRAAIVLDRFFGKEQASREAGSLAAVALVCFVGPGILFLSPNYFYLVSLPIAALLFLQVRLMSERTTAASLNGAP